MYNMEISYNLFILAALAGLALSTPVHDNYHGYNRYSGYGSHSRRCSSPKYPYHGGYDGTDDYYSIGHKLTYYCDDGYDMYGSGYSTCKYSSRYNRGYWDNYTPYCRPARKLCPTLDAPENGNVQQTGRYPGDKATYSCNQGYDLVGSDTRFCQRNGEWSEEAPVCQSVDCGPLRSPDNGNIHVSGTTLGNIARTYCDHGYEPALSDRRECLYTGWWPDSEPDCIPVDCGYPDPADPNGWRKGPNGTTLGSIATYKCHRGYITESFNLTIKCLYTGNWSGNAPVCIPVDCKDPPDPDPNGSVNYDATTFGNRAYYSCNPGYILVGSATLECLYTGMWNDSAPVCEPVDCGAPDAPDENGSVEVDDTTLGNKATYRCKRGFILVGSSVVECLYTGEWNDTAPVCKRISCPELSDPENGRVHASGYYPHDRAYYQCNYGHYLEGSSRRICTHNGSWTGSDPKCVKRYYRHYDYHHDGYKYSDNYNHHDRGY